VTVDLENLPTEETAAEAEYALERAVTCPACKETVQKFHVVRTLRTKVNFTSNLPRRGYAILCPSCDAVLSANIGSRVL
jgi:hypothetical protein